MIVTRNKVDLTPNHQQLKSQSQQQLQQASNEQQQLQQQIQLQLQQQQQQQQPQSQPQPNNHHIHHQQQQQQLQQQHLIQQLQLNHISQPISTPSTSNSSNISNQLSQSQQLSSGYQFHQQSTQNNQNIQQHHQQQPIISNLNISLSHQNQQHHSQSHQQHQLNSSSSHNHHNQQHQLHHHHNHHHQHINHNQRTHTIMPPEDAANGRKPDPWYGLEITGSVRNLSPSLWNMTHITSLYLNDNCLTRLPPDIGRLTQLRHLDLSSNKLRALPREIGELILLEELLLNDNQLRTLPFEMGRLFHLKRLGLKGNTSLNQELLQIYQEPKGTQKLITYLLEHFAVQCPAPRPPQRPWILMDQPVDRTKPSCMFTTMCYNVLCDKYATRQLYGYCPAWALNWDYRKHYILEELKGYSADVIALQEIETEQFHDYFLKELQAEGYEGIFSPKSRAKTMSEFERKHVDGCAIFFKTSKFSLVQEHLVEFNQLAMANAEGSDDMLNRVMTKDNIALVALLQIKEGAFDSFQPGSGGSGSGASGGGGSAGGVNVGSSSNSGDSVVGGSNRNMDGGSGSGGGGNGSTIINANTGAAITMTERPLHQQRILVCTAHIHWDPEFCDVKIIQTIMLMHELQAIANQAAKDLLISSGQNINSIKQYYLENGTSSSTSSETAFGHNHIQLGRTTSAKSASGSNCFKDQDDSGGTGTGGDQFSLLAEQLGPELIPLILCVDSNSLPESSVVEFLSNGGISADHPDFKELAYKDCLRKMCSSTVSGMANNQYWNQSASKLSSSNSTSISSSSASDDQLKSQQPTPKDSSTNTSNGNGNQRQLIKNDAVNHSSTSGGGSSSNTKGTTINSESTHYSHPFAIATAYTGEGTMPFTNYTFDFKGVIDYIFYSKNLMSVLGVSGLDKSWLVENKIPGLPHPYFPSDHFPLYVELEVLPTPRSVNCNRYKQLQPNHQQTQQHHPQLNSQHPQHNRKNDFFQTPMRKPFFGT